MARPCIIPVCANDAVLWAAGHLTDRDLFLRAALKPEAVFIADLPDRRSYVQCCRSLLYWASEGAVTVICRTSSPAVEKKLASLDAVPCLVEMTEPVKVRYLLPPAGFARWLAKMHHQNAL